MRTWHVFALAAVAMLLPTSVLKAQEAVKIGVCNPAKVFESMDERKVIEDKMKSERDKAAGEVNRRKQEVEDLQRQRNELRPESAIFQEKTNQMMEKAVQFEVWARMKQAEMDRSEKEQIKALYEKIRESCKEIATEKKIDLILAERKPELPANMEKLTADQVRQIISANDVLYANEKADITQMVIMRVNQKYAAGGGIAPPAGAGATNTGGGVAPQK
jgi:Skp family chaperone for outer membrane proteins